MMSDSKCLLVTGASGFLGTEVMRLARQAGWQVRALVRNGNTDLEGVEKVIGSLEDPDALERACLGASAVIHTAGLAHVFGRDALRVDSFTQVNELGTANLITAAIRAAVHRVVIASSVSVYGASADRIACDESASCQPVSPYAISKRRAELRAGEIVAGSSMDLVILRFATIYGQGDRGNVAKLIAALRKGRFVWLSTGGNRKSLIYREDAARACLLAVDKAPAGVSVFNVAPPPATMQQIVAAICGNLRRPVPRFRIPQALLTGVTRLSQSFGDPGHLGVRMEKFVHDDVYVGTAFEHACGFAAKVSLEEGLWRQISADVPNNKQPT